MGKAYSIDLRDRVYSDVESGLSRRAAARRFGVSASTGVRLAQRMAATGSLAPSRQGRPAGSGKLATCRDIVIGWVEAQGDITLHELAERLLSEHGVKVHLSSLSRLLTGAGFTVNKNTAGERNRSR
jgi:transposase